MNQQKLESQENAFLIGLEAKKKQVDEVRTLFVTRNTTQYNPKYIHTSLRHLMKQEKFPLLKKLKAQKKAQFILPLLLIKIVCKF